MLENHEGEYKQLYWTDRLLETCCITEFSTNEWWQQKFRDLKGSVIPLVRVSLFTWSMSALNLYLFVPFLTVTRSRSCAFTPLIWQMGDRRGRLKRQSARVSGQGSQNLYSKLQFLRDFWWLFLWFGDSFRSKLSNYFVFCTKVIFLFTSIFYPNFYPLLPSRFVSITWS